MPKKPKIRATYHADAQYLLRLAHAIEFDETRPPWWRREVIAMVRHLASQFMEARGQEKATQEGKVQENIPQETGIREEETEE